MVGFVIACLCRIVLCFVDLFVACGGCFGTFSCLFEACCFCFKVLVVFTVIFALLFVVLLTRLWWFDFVCFVTVNSVVSMLLFLLVLFC